MGTANIESAMQRELPHLTQALTARREQLSREVEDGQQRRLSEDSYRAVAGEVADSGDASLAAEQLDLRTTQIERDLAELRDVESALDRINAGTYGTCVRCGRDIGIARLRANPAAPRCIECQTAIEHQFAGNATPSL
jgi:RNA polymerase-binding protein DksA